VIDLFWILPDIFQLQNKLQQLSTDYTIRNLNIIYKFQLCSYRNHIYIILYPFDLILDMFLKLLLRGFPIDPVLKYFKFT